MTEKALVATHKTSVKIHIISTVNGQVNEGMRNVATHISKALETNHKVFYSGLKDIVSIIKNSYTCDATLIFARANKHIYWLTKIVAILAKNVWLVCVQKPDAGFTQLARKKPLKINYLAIVENDLRDIPVPNGFNKDIIGVGIKLDKFKPVNNERQRALKVKYGFDEFKPLVIHVGHCSAGRGLEDFTEIKDAQRMVVSSGMFENANTVNTLLDSGVTVHKGYLENVEEIYQMADVYLFPTRSTEYVISIPLSVMEALSCGVPVIGYKDFPNLCSVGAADGSITLIDRKEELNKVIAKTVKKKQNISLLLKQKTWEQVADDVMDIVRSSLQ